MGVDIIGKPLCIAATCRVPASVNWWHHRQLHPQFTCIVSRNNQFDWACSTFHLMEHLNNLCVASSCYVSFISTWMNRKYFFSPLPDHFFCTHFLRHSRDFSPGVYDVNFHHFQFSFAKFQLFKHHQHDRVQKTRRKRAAGRETSA